LAEDAPGAQRRQPAAGKQEAWRTEVPWMQKLVPHLLPEGITYCRILRQPRNSAYIGYYKHSPNVVAPRGVRRQSKQEKFGCCKGKQVTEHMAAATAVKWVWDKHIRFIPTELPQEVTEFIQDCEACAKGEGDCQVLQRMEIHWRANQGSEGDRANQASAGHQASDRSGSDESSSDESSSAEAPAE
jgi:hypothetical protein